MTTTNASSLHRTAVWAVIVAAALAAIAAPALAETPRPMPASYAPAGLIGPKKSVAVIDFGSNGAFQGYYGAWQAGGGPAAMLETELSATGRFRMVGRSHLDSVLYEQQLGELGLNGAKTAKAGQLTGAQFLIRGSVTDFTLAEKGGGFSIGGNLGGGLIGGLSPQSREGRVSLDFQVIDSTSGEVVDSFSVTRKVKSTSLAITASKSGISGGANSFNNTPLGKAAREAIAEAAHRITMSLSDRDWSGRVAQVRGEALYVNAGADSGLRVGDTLSIHRVVEKITDPVTGALLGVEKAEIGRAQIASVSDQYATARFQASYAPQVGDVLTVSTR